MDTLFIILVSLFYGGIGTALALFGVTESISAIYYKIIERFGKNWGAIFTLWFFALAFITSILMIEILEGKWYQFLGFFSGAGLGFVGAAPLFKEQSQKWVHYAGACISGLSIFLISILNGMFDISIILIILAAIFATLTKMKALTYWGEQALFGLGFYFIYINIIVLL